METPLVSCIIPAFNGEAFLDSALDSVLGQTYPAIEVLVVDDGSTDGTADLLARYGKDIRYVGQDNAGPAAACNHGLLRSRGAFCAFLEQDDLWQPMKVEIQMRALEKPQVDYCVTMIENFTEDSLSNGTGAIPAARSGPLPGYVTQTLLARRSAFQRAGLFDTRWRFCHATEWFLRARRQGLRGELIPDVLVRRRIHRSNVSLRHPEASRDEYLEMIKRCLDNRSQR